MGLLDKLWDDVVAGPMPDRGLGRLRKPGMRHHFHDSAAEHDDGGGKNRTHSPLLRQMILEEDQGSGFKV
jgi:hypothetical protein